MRSVLPIAIIIGLALVHAGAGELDVRTVHGAVLCATPFQLRKAIVASHRDETQRVWQLGCMRAGRGMKVSLFDGIAPSGPWQVQSCARRWSKPDLVGLRVQLHSLSRQDFFTSGRDLVHRPRVSAV